MWWKASIDSSNSNTSKILTSILLKSINGRFTTRLNFADGTFEDLDIPRLPRFDLGEIVTISLREDMEVPSRNTPSPVED